MENDVYIQICDGFQRGATKEETFKNICLRIYFYPPSDLKICDWFERTRGNDFTLEEEIGEYRFKLLFLIIGQYTKFAYAISHREVVDLDYGNEKFMQNRFNLAVKGASFEIFDSYNEKSRMLQSTIVTPANGLFQCLTMLSHDRMLLIMGDGRFNHLFLLDVDFSGSKCSILNKIPIDSIYFQIIVDSMDATKFLLYGDDYDGLTLVYKGKIVDDRISFEDHQIELESELFHEKLVNGKLFAFEFDGGDLNFVEYDLNSSLARKLNEWSCFSHLSKHIRHKDAKFVWSGNKLYVVYRFHADPLRFSIILVDVDSHMLSEMKIIGVGHVDALTIDEDEILIVSATENSYVKGKPILKTVYHFPMRKPDKLRYLAWKKIRREALFARSELYEKFSPRLPFNSEFRPFDEDS